MINCKVSVDALRARITRQIFDEVKMARAVGVNCDLPVIFVQPPNDPRSASYIKSKEKILKTVGLKSITILAPEDATYSWYWRLFRCAKAPLLLQEPIALRDQYQEVLVQVPWEYDVDALQRFYTRHYSKLDTIPCTVWGIVQIINDYFRRKFNVQGTTVGGYLKEFPNKNSRTSYYGKTMTIVGRGKLVGAPLTKALQDLGATVINCNAGTDRETLKKAIKMSDVVVSAVGKYGVIDSDMFDEDQNCLVVDAGTDTVDGVLKGDFKRNIADEECCPGVEYTPVPGGVGPMTVLGVAKNSLEILKNLDVANPLKGALVQTVLKATLSNEGFEFKEDSESL